jgi:hypothetical protein
MTEVIKITKVIKVIEYSKVTKVIKVIECPNMMEGGGGNIHTRWIGPMNKS